MIDCWIFDMDGTLCNSDHRMHYLANGKRDWAGWFKDIHLDPPHLDVVQFYHYAVEKNIPVFICTGRDDSSRPASQKWLDDHGVTEIEALYMRHTGDTRDDSIAKKEMLEQIRALGYNPVLAFDDRDRVVKMWRENGVRCFQVAPGDF
jgi:beta-phosphoglucomutase-like phosphatase (HAD superfamily)